ncbi:11-beta-hydroxysteroid dehydrogenase 1B-like [Canna indica]|uniref:11-beta-hydroxysteroid dehydrogenase 1B-like n=1 Tax=Canna indica TaxID=4628 RepID=A0AAQ3JWH2_9LILI|nr:11-beta-hydroxysteroid dehydrogenase 1B-like [Canna indica]
MEFFNSFLGVVVHLFIALVLMVYLPISLVCKLPWRIFLRPFYKEDLRGKVVLITGASSGIGEQLAYQYAERGASMAIVARRANALHVVAKKAREHGAPDVLVVTADISDPDQSRLAIEETIAHFGRLDHLVANAGVWSTCLFEEITNLTAFNQVMDVNFWGAVYPTYYAIPHLKKSKGKIIVNASFAGRVPTARMTFYNASKAATIMFYESLRSELGSDVGITLVTLGYVASELTKGKALQVNGELGINEEARDIQVGPLPIGSTDKCAEIIVDGACMGDKYITWPTWYKPFAMVMSLAPELVDMFSQSFYVSKPGDDSGIPLGKKILNMKGIKELLYPDSVLSPSAKVKNKE